MKRKSSVRLLIMSFICVMLLLIVIIHIDEKILPTALNSAEMKVRAEINTIMLHSVRNIIEEMNLITSDFYKKNGDTFIIDTVLINHFCNNVAANISHELSSMQNQKISVPSGTLTGIKSLSNYGPDFTVVLKPMGSVMVDYDSSFVSAGINQVNFQIWLNIESGVRIVNPLQTNQIEISRKISLVNTIITGEVPAVYMENK